MGGGWSFVVRHRCRCFVVVVWLFVGRLVVGWWLTSSTSLPCYESCWLRFGSSWHLALQLSARRRRGDRCNDGGVGCYLRVAWLCLVVWEREHCSNVGVFIACASLPLVVVGRQRRAWKVDAQEIVAVTAVECGDEVFAGAFEVI